MTWCRDIWINFLSEFTRTKRWKLLLLSLVVCHTNLSAQLRMVVNDVYTQTETIDISNGSVHIQQASTILDEVVLQIFKGRYFTDEKLIQESQFFNVSGGNNYYALTEIFSTLKIPYPEQKYNLLSFRLINAHTQTQLAIYSINVLQNTNDTGRVLSRNKLIELDGTLRYQINRSSGNIDSINSIGNYQSLELNTQFKVRNIPFQLNGIASDFEDPYLDYNISNITTYFDVQKWSKEQKAKARKYVESEVSNQVQQIPGYESIVRKHEYIERLFEHKDMLADIENIENSYELMDSLGLINLTDIDNKIKAHLAEKNSIGNLLDSLDKSSVSDSLVRRIDEIENDIEKLRTLSQTVQKRQTYINLINQKDSLDQLMDRVSDIDELRTQLRNETLNNPSKLNRKLESLGLIKDYEKVLNYIQEFRFGILSVDYSKLLLQGSRNDGLALAFGTNKWNIHAFKSRLSGRKTRINNDSLGITRISLVGTKLAYTVSDVWTNEFFLITALSPLVENDVPKSSVGYNLRYKTDLKKFNLEAVWSRMDTQVQEGGSNFENTVSNLALELNFGYNNKERNFSYSGALAYVGPEYIDFNNPFLLNDQLKFSARASKLLHPNWRLGTNVFLQQANLWGDVNSLNHRWLFGVNQQYNKQGVPAINYNAQLGITQIEGESVQSQLHNLNTFYNFKIGGHEAFAILSINRTQNIADIDSLNFNSSLVSFNQNYEINERLKIDFVVSYQHMTKSDKTFSKDVSYECSLPLNYGAFFLNAGVKMLSINQSTQFGWFTQLQYNFHGALHLNLILDSMQRSNFLDEFGAMQHNYYSRYNGSLNYTF